MKKTIRSKYGLVKVWEESPQLICVHGESDSAAYFGQGYMTAKTRLWQLELTRRVGQGTLSEIFGLRTLDTDQFQRKLGLVALAERDYQQERSESQQLWIQAYVDGINFFAEKQVWRPLEFLLMRLRFASFRPQDVYLIAHLKYFINSTWKAEILQTRLAKMLDTDTFEALFRTYPSPESLRTEAISFPFLSDYPEQVMSGLQLLGLDAPDVGSNIFVLRGENTVHGFPILACDPHMGHVSPSFNLLCKLKSAEKLNVFGANFPGTPGIYSGRNLSYAWGMVGLMADNQDLFCGEINLAEKQVKIAGKWHPLEETNSLISVKGAPEVAFSSYSFPTGRLLFQKVSYGLFLRWPALDSDIGDIVFHDLNTGIHWSDFQQSLKSVYTSPMMVLYGDMENNIGLQAIGLIPKRSSFPGSFVLSLEQEEYFWKGYVPFSELPQQFNPPEGYFIYSNHYAPDFFSTGPFISNRWHPPTRYLRIKQLLKQHLKHSTATIHQIQEDRVDAFVSLFLQYFSALLDPNPFLDWDGNTQQVELTLLFEAWFYQITMALLTVHISETLAKEYQELWPMYRWNILQMLLQKKEAEDLLVLQSLLRNSLVVALQEKHFCPKVVFRHTLGRGFWGEKLFNYSALYQGGTRETIHVERKNIDFLSAGQTGEAKQNSFNFGPSFKMICSLDPTGDIFYLSSTASQVFPGSRKGKQSFKRWCSGLRYQTQLEK